MYPEWSYFPRNVRPPDWVAEVVSVVAVAESEIGTLTTKGPTSDAVLAVLAPGLASMGFAVEVGKAKAGKIRRPVLYGANGIESVAYELDAFHDQLGIAVEVEAGRGAVNNADYRDIIRASLVLDSRFLVILMPQHYWSVGGTGNVRAYRSTLSLVEAIYASQRLQLPFQGLLVVGY